jgi:polysaccharide deacetylase family protein (PEP-CTERM system associated)
MVTQLRLCEKLQMRNALSVDLEDYYQVSAFSGESGHASSKWDSFESRVEANTDRLLDLLAERGTSATFFTLGWVARKYPKLIRKVADAGHEIACHSNAHRRVFEMTPVEFREDTVEAKRSLEDAGGTPVSGYRAPSFSITQKSIWAFSILVELGFKYDSSIFPIRHPNYGIVNAPTQPFDIITSDGRITEFPLSTLSAKCRRAPLAGGAYFRFLPYWYTHWGVHYLNLVEGRPVCVYLHPWELDCEQPRMQGSLSAHLRHYLGLRANASKFRRLLRDFEFEPVGSLIASLEARQGSLTAIHAEQLGLD